MLSYREKKLSSMLAAKFIVILFNVFNRIPHECTILFKFCLCLLHSIYSFKERQQLLDLSSFF